MHHGDTVEVRGKDSELMTLTQLLMEQLKLTISPHIKEKMMEKQVIDKFKLWLGPKGIHFFRTLHKTSGTVSPVLRTNGPIPGHVVHFREGMQVRNWMRDQEEFKDYNAHDFDNHWMELVEEAIK